MTELDKKLLKAIESTSQGDQHLVDFIFKYLKDMPEEHKGSYIEVKEEMRPVDSDSYHKNRGKYIDWMFKGDTINKQKNTQNYK
jgi:ADP-dependent phosphofructokinase/glucokinase